MFAAKISQWETRIKHQVKLSGPHRARKPKKARLWPLWPMPPPASWNEHTRAGAALGHPAILKPSSGWKPLEASGLRVRTPTFQGLWHHPIVQAGTTGQHINSLFMPHAGEGKVSPWLNAGHNSLKTKRLRNVCIASERNIKKDPNQQLWSRTVSRLERTQR